MSASDPDTLTLREMELVDKRIQAAVKSDVVLINQVGNYILAAGGKRMRPKLVILSALAHGYSGSHHVDIAAIIEFIHTATLLHDDVVDSSDMRRGRDTANQVWGNEAAVLVGDFLYSRAFEMMVEVGQMRVMEVLAGATNTIAAGEVMQLLNIREPDITEQAYMEVIRAKTAMLFEAAARLGAIVARAERPAEQAIAAYGSHLGTAFQLVDDLLDYTADDAELGKNTGDDLAEGKPTLPLILAMRDGDKQARALIRTCIADEGAQINMPNVLDAVRRSGAIDKTLEAARGQVRLAVDSLTAMSPGIYKDALVSIAESSVDRRS